MNKKFWGNCYRNEALKTSIISTFFIGMIAHGYAFLNFFPSHDYLYGITMNGRWQIELGRFLVPVYKAVFGTFSMLPWTSGLVSLIWLGLSVFLLADIFQLNNKWQIVMLSGVVVTNITMTALAATYIPWIGQDTLALLMAVSACWCWQRYETQQKKRWMFFSGCVCIIISLGLYQAYIAVFVTLVVIVSIFRLIDNIDEKLYWKKTLFSDLRAVGMTALAGCGYAIILKLVCVAGKISLNNGSYNSVTNAWKSTEPIYAKIFWAYAGIAETFLGGAQRAAYPNYVFRIVHILLLCIGIFLGAKTLMRAAKRKVSKTNIILLIFLVVFLPMGMNCIRLLNESVHQLMQFAFWFFYLFVLLLALRYMGDIRKKVQIVKCTCVLLLAVFVVNIQTSNAAYIKKSIEQQTTLSIMTRVVDKIEGQENYVAGETKVAFIGTPSSYTTANNSLQYLAGITGEGSRTAISYYGVYKKYFENILQTPINLMDEEDVMKISKQKNIQKMACFPKKGSVICENNIVIVKFSEQDNS